MHSTRVYFNNIGSMCRDSLRHGNGLSALLLLTRAAKSSAAKSSAAKTRSMESRLYTDCSKTKTAAGVGLSGRLLTRSTFTMKSVFQRNMSTNVTRRKGT